MTVHISDKTTVRNNFLQVATGMKCDVNILYRLCQCATHMTADALLNCEGRFCTEPLYSSSGWRNSPHPLSLSVSSAVNQNRQASAASRSHNNTHTRSNKAQCTGAHEETQTCHLLTGLPNVTHLPCGSVHVRLSVFSQICMHGYK